MYTCLEELVGAGESLRGTDGTAGQDRTDVVLWTHLNILSVIALSLSDQLKMDFLQGKSVRQSLRGVSAFLIILFTMDLCTENIME